MTNVKNPNEESQRQSRSSIKTLIASISLAATVGGWAMLSADREPVMQVKLAPTMNKRPNTATIIELAPLPTLVPPPSISSTLATTLSATPTPIPLPTLRAVNQPPPMRIVYVGGGGDGGDSGGGGGGGGGGSQAAAQTQSSR